MNEWAFSAFSGNNNDANGPAASQRLFPARKTQAASVACSVHGHNDFRCQMAPYTRPFEYWLDVFDEIHLARGGRGELSRVHFPVLSAKEETAHQREG